MTQDEPQSRHIPESILDKRQLRVYGHPLTIRQQIWLGFILPTIFSAVLFIASFAIDAGVTHQLFRDGHWCLATISLLIVYVPAVVCLVLSLWKTPKLGKPGDSILWFILQIIHFVFFPIGVMHRYATRIFWSICALHEDDPEREEALSNASVSHQTELFLLMDAFLHAAPQAVLQAYILLSPEIITRDETDLTQAMSVIVSVASLAKAVALYRRYESQRVVGRPAPWTLRKSSLNAQRLVTMIKLGQAAKKGQPQGAAEDQEAKQTECTPEVVIMTHPSTGTGLESAIDIEKSQVESAQTGRESRGEEKVKENDPLLPQTVQGGRGEGSEMNDEDTSTQTDADHERQSNRMAEEPGGDDYLVPHKIERVQETVPSPSDMPTHKTTADESALGSPSEYGILNHMQSNISPPEALAVDLPTSSEENPTQSTISSLKLPERKPRTKGLNEDEPLGIVVAFFGWWCFLMARVLAIAAFTHFYFWPSVGLLIGHYFVMVAYLCFCGPCLNPYAPVLGLEFILCPVELRVRFRRPRLFIIAFIVIAITENISTLAVWYFNATWESWWYNYTCYTIIGSQGMAALHTALYLVLFNPNVKYLDL